MPFDLDTNVRNANSIYGSPDDVWGSAATTLEYAVDDFAIAQFAARALRDRATYRAFMQRSGNWRKLFDPAQRHDRAALRKRRLSSQLRQPAAAAASSRATPPSTPGWCPTIPAGLFRAMGGPRRRRPARLDRFLRKLNGGAGGTHTDHALLGNEPNLHVALAL